ncbi:E3 ubiquitin-protein ligase listerin-like [Ornithodoros turicata]|uniref:E3 ubiquitin-protein ligase listerin-like n=1 Tax=Ornithodoros turicata TaxID=34597 RepID=UPI003139FA60
MGGPKKGQRTKGNARPSSSGRSAELLSASGTGLTGFVGFGGLAGDYVPPTGQHTGDDVDASVDSDFRLVLRKLTKRDNTTRLKALQELVDVIREKDADAVKGALPFWPRLYNKLAVDNDRRVREATHRAHEQLCLKVKRNLAPHAKAMVGVWVASQCDPFAPAASAARAAFAAAFPSAKQAQVLSFFAQEIFGYCSDMVLVQVPTTLPDSKGLPKEEQEAKYFRCLTCALLGLKLLVDNLSPLPDLTALTAILDESKFWKFAKHTEVTVRKSWYGLMTSVCQHVPELASKHAKQLSGVTLNSLAETEPLITVAIWETSLALLSSVPDCWQHVNARKAVLPQLWRVLKGGGFGSATHVYPNLLPFLSLIPADVIGDGAGFYEAFFANIREGLAEPKVHNIPSETNAIVQAYMECLRYALTRNLGSDNNAVAIREYLTVELHSLLDTSLTDPKNRLSSSTLYHNVAELHSYCLRQSSSAELDPSHRASFQKMLTTFWDHVQKVGLDILSSDPPNTKQIQRLTGLINEIHNPSAPKVKRRVTIALPSEEEEEVVARATKSVAHLKRLPSILEGHRSILNYTTKLCAAALQRATSSGDEAYVQALSSLLRSASSDAFVRDLLQDLGTPGGTERTAAFALLEVLRPLLEAKKDQECDREAVLGHAVDCLLTVSSSAKTDEVVVFFDSVVESGRHVFAVVLEKSLACWESHPGMKKWLQGPQLVQKLVDLASQLIPTTLEESDMEHVWRILRASIGTANISEPLISSSDLSAILATIQKSLQRFASAEPDKKKDLWEAVNFVCDVTLALFSSYQDCSHLASSGDLLHTLFLLDCQNAAASGITEKVGRAWRQGVHTIVKAQGGFVKDDGVLHKISSSIHSQLLTDLSSEKCNILIECTSRYLESIYSALPKDDHVQCNPATMPVIATVLDLVLPSEEEWERLARGHSLLERLPLHLKERKKRPYLQASSYEPPAVSESALREVARFTENVLTRLLALSVGEPREDEDIESASEVVAEERNPEILRSANFLALAKCLSSTASCSRRDTTNEATRAASDGLALRAFLKPHDRKLFHKFIDRVLRGEHIWLEALSDFLESMPKADAGRLCISHLEDVKEGLTENAEILLVVQTLLPYCPDSLKQVVFTTCMGHLVCWDPSLGCAKTPQLLLLLAKAIESTELQPLEDVVSVLYFLQGIRGSHPELYLRDEAEQTLTNDEREFAGACCLYLSAVLSRCPQVLQPVNWDFILLSLAMWMEKFNWKQSIHAFSTNQLMFANDLLALLLCVSTVIDESSSARTLCNFPENIVTEWKEFYTETIFSALIPGFITLTDAAGVLNDAEETVVSALRASLALASEVQIVKFTKCSSDDLSSLNALMSKLTPLMTSKSCAVQLGCSKLLETIVPLVARLDAELLTSNEEAASSRPPPGPLLSILKETGQIVDALLSDFEVGDCCVVQPKTDSYTYTLAYLLSWSQLLSFFRASPAEARSEYAEYLQEAGVLANLLRHLFCLMPENINLTSPTSGSPVKGRTMFSQAVTFTPAEEFTSLKLQHVACQTYLDTISKLPALVRSWWNSQNKRIMDHVERFTSKYVTGVICSRELQAVQKAEVAFKNMTVKARPVAREVVATHTIEEVAMELIVRLPANHPLGAVTIESGRRVGVGNNQWRHWLLQLTTFLTHQNGSILDGLALWKRNIDKRFEGVEECMICFYVLHGATCQLPSLSCRICKKRFHSACLFKWFSTSNNSTCPLCRNIF